MQSHRKQAGFTVFELVLAMTVMSLMIGPFVFQKIQSFEEDRIGITVAEVNDLFQSAQNYAAKESGDWPSEGDNCASAIAEMENEGYLDGFSVRTSFGTDLTTSCTTGNAKRFMVTVDANSEGNADLLSGYLPSSTVTGDIVTVSVPMPAAIPALEHLVPRDGSREMTGDLDMDSNDIINANQVETETVLLNSVVASGDGCATNGMIARDNNGRLLSCVSGQWTGAEGTPAMMVAYFNSASCPDGWTVSNGANGTQDVRGTFLRALDQGRGLDAGRTLGSYQEDRMQRITGHVDVKIEGGRGLFGGTSGAFSRSRNRGNVAVGGNYPATGGRRLHFDSADSVRTGPETNPKNVALLACQKLP